MKQYLIDTFKFNDWANKQLLESIKKMPDPEKAVSLFSHLINSQNKWIAGINGNPDEPNMKWFPPVYGINELEDKWNESINTWLSFLENNSEELLECEVVFSRQDGSKFGVKINDMALQLNYHSIHHRAQIATLLREQEIPPPFLDYIGRVWKKY
ncbi:MAG: hypothetical protein EHM58_00010 [Ignavibacteriae bacterium]|nr:MAG: hypothetical protein EHM58_00010 [Ignavibacteriota bacterium]